MVVAVDSNLFVVAAAAELGAVVVVAVDIAVRVAALELQVVGVQ